MPEHRQIRVTGAPRTEPDVDLLTEFIVLLGRQLAQEAAAGGNPAGGPPSAPVKETA